MNTIIYLIRHSEPTKIISHLINNDNLQIRNEKTVLSTSGEKKTEKLSSNEEMKNVDVVISSNYVGAIATAKYIAEYNNTNINIIDEFGERKFGIDNWDELPNDFEKKQIEDDVLDLINELEEKENIDYYDDILEENHSRHKIGGYPSYIQGGVGYDPGYEFVLQITSDSKANFNIVDSGNFYFGYNPTTKDWSIRCDFY